MKLDAIFFDFDGVILDSVDVKTRSFAEMFKVYGSEIERQVVNYHLTHGGISRFEKFRYFYENFLQQAISEEKLLDLGEEFSRITFAGVVNSRFIDGALEILAFLKEKKVLSFIVSGTPQGELRKVVNIKKISPYFAEVHGSPRKKTEIVFDIMARFALAKKRCLFVGDAMTDYDAALIAGVDFLGVVPVGKVSPFPEKTNICVSLKFLRELIL